MLKHIYKGGIAMALLTIAACSADTFTEVLTPGDTLIMLNGTVTRAASDTEKGELKLLTGYTGLKLSAKYGDDFYFKNEDITVGAADGTNTNQNKLTTSVRYPAGNKTINLFAHTGDVGNDGNLTLTSGNKAANDILLSNGADNKGAGDDEGNGTAGSSDSNAQLLTFRHVMTKVEVAADYSLDNNLQETKPTTISIKFGTKVAAKGTIAITSKLSESTTKAAAATGDKGYALQLKDNYLVPTGETLSGKGIITELKIDDYTATADDLKELEIAPDDESKPFLLAPGLSYKLTLKIKRLKVVGITLVVDDWNPNTDAKPEWGYDPYKMTLSVDGGYDASTEANQITQVVLHHAVDDKDYQYVGKGLYNDTDSKTDIEFLSIPKTLDENSTLTIDAYTKYGLLIEGQKVSYSSSGSHKGDIKLSLSANGMVSDGNVYLISTPLQFYNFLSNPQGNTKYRIFKNIDMDALKEMPAITLTEFPSGSTLEGGTYTETVNGTSITRTNSILHLNREGGLFSINKGTLKNIYIFSGTITAGSSTHIGSICNVNEGTIEGCVNEADLVPSANQIAGGICGKNSGTILACLNTGNIQTGTTVGGICGENTNTTAGIIKACINTGMLNKKADKLGGICGTTDSSTDNKFISTCYWLTGTARKDQDINNETAVGSDTTNDTHCSNASDLAPERLRANDIIQGLSDAASSWSFELTPKICVWPIPIAVTTP